MSVILRLSLRMRPFFSDAIWQYSTWQFRVALHSNARVKDPIVLINVAMCYSTVENLSNSILYFSRKEIVYSVSRSYS